jgi:periplasmic protein TonB
MFEGFETAKDEQAKKRWFASAGTSLVIYGIVGIGILILAKQTVTRAATEAPIDVTFHAAPEVEAAKPPPPPPPPPPTGNRAKKAGKPAPEKVTAIPEDRPEEAEPTGEAAAPIVPELYGEGGDGLGDSLPVTPPPPPPPPPVVENDPDPVHETVRSTAPQPRPGNVQPVYPDKMRHKGVQADVVLKVRISATGEVVSVEVISGEEPFVSAAIAAVKAWHFTPATLDGKPVAVVRKVNIPFRIRS